MANFYQRDGEFPRLLGTPNIHQLFKSPEPRTLFRQSVGDFPRVFNAPKTQGMSPPTPYAFFIQKEGVNNGFPYLNYPDCYDLGAFTNATSLVSVSFPSTLVSIGKFSFSNTALTEVTLPEKCTYYSTSFPKNCIVKGGNLIG